MAPHRHQAPNGTDFVQVMLKAEELKHSQAQTPPQQLWDNA